MTRPPRRIALLIAAAVAAMAALGYASWSRRSTGGTDAASAALARVTLPDVSRLDPAVQTQVRDRHARMSAVVGAAQSSAAEQADAYGSMGQVLLAAEYRTEAEAAFRNAQALAPDDVRWPYYLGHVHRARQDPARAIEAFQRVLDLAPDDVPSLTWLGDLYLASGDPASAEAPLLRALALQPASAAAASRLGRAALAQGDYARAVEYLERARREQPDAAGVHYSLGMAYRGLGQAAKAEEHLRQGGAGGDPSPADPLMDAVAALLRGAGAFEARGMEALDAREWSAAVDNLRQAVVLAPANAVTRLNLGTALSLAGDPFAAERELLEAVRLDPRLARAHFALGVLAQDAGRWRDAVGRFETAVRTDGGLVDARFGLAEALRRTGRPGDAVAQYRALLALDPAASQARFGLSMAFVRLKRFGDARATLEEAVAVHPGQPGFPHALARVLAAAPDAAVRDGRRALGLMEPLVTAEASPAVAETMAMVMAELARFDDASRWQERAIDAAAAAGQAGLAERMQDNLRLYRRRQPCRTPWRDDDPVIAVAQP